MNDRRFLVLTPACDGSDGISELSRQVIGMLVAEAGADRVEVWAFEGALRPAGTGGSMPAFRSAHRSRLRIGAWALAKAASPLGHLTVVVMHAHLSPLATPLAWRGARVAVFLIGIEVWRRLRGRERRALEQAERLIAISAHTARRFREANPELAVLSTTVCPLGIGSGPARREAAPDSGFALIVARMSAQERYKGHDRLIDCWPAVRARVHDARLLIAGAGDDRARLEARVAAAGLNGAIRFTGRLTDEALAGLYRAASVFVMPSASEGFGLTYLEAMRAGKPCIALHGSADEIIEHEVSGLVVDAEPPDALVHAIVRLLTDAPLRARMGAAAAARVEEHFTVEHFAERFRSALGLEKGQEGQEGQVGQEGQEGQEGSPRPELVEGRELSAPGVTDDARRSATSSGSREPLRVAHAPSNSGGGGVPAAIGKSEAPRALENVGQAPATVRATRTS